MIKNYHANITGKILEKVLHKYYKKLIYFKNQNIKSERKKLWKLKNGEETLF